MKNNKNFLLMSLEDEKAKKIAHVLSNKSCSKILDYLTQNESTESEIAKELNLPISTVHYNLKQLMKAKLIIADKYHYSEKGKEVKHYTVANKYIIITPKGEEGGFLDILKNLIPTIGILGIGAYLINWYNNLGYESYYMENSVMYDAAPAVGGARVAQDTMMLKAMPTEEVGYNMAEPVIESIPWYSDIIYQNWFWFLIGALSGILIYLSIRWIRKKL